MQADALHCRHEFIAHRINLPRQPAPRRRQRAKTIAAANSALSLVDMAVLWCWNANRMKSKVIAILETRAGAHLAELVTRRGGSPLLAPALEEVPDIDPKAVRSLLAQWRVQPFKICIFQTGVGTRALFAAADAAEFKRGIAGTPGRIDSGGARPEASGRAQRARRSHRHQGGFAVHDRESSRAARGMCRWRAHRFWCSAMAKPIKRSAAGLTIPRRHGAGDRHLPLGVARRHAAAHRSFLMRLRAGRRCRCVHQRGSNP